MPDEGRDGLIEECAACGEVDELIGMEGFCASCYLSPESPDLGSAS